MMKKILITAYSYIAALIGAGFASGQEILCFFVKYGKAGFYGIALSSLIFAAVIYFVANICIKNNITSYRDFINFISPGKTGIYISFISGIFSIAVFSAMLAAADNMGIMLFGTPKGAFSLIASVICMYAFTRTGSALLSANGAAGILITTGIISCTLYMLCYREFHVSSEFFESMGSSYIYSGYNLISLIPIIVISSIKLCTREEAFTVSVISGFSMFIMMLMMFALIAIYHGKINLGEIPMLTLAMRQNTTFSFIYALLLTSAIATTLLSSGEAFIEAFKLHNRNISLFLIIISSYALSSAGLANLVNHGYRLFGIISAVIITYVVVKIFKINRL